MAIYALYNIRQTIIIKPVIIHALLESQLALYEAHFPKKLEQLIEVARAAGFNTYDFLYRSIRMDIEWHKHMNEPEKGCAIFGATNQDGTYVGRNYD